MKSSIADYSSLIDLDVSKQLEDAKISTLKAMKITALSALPLFITFFSTLISRSVSFIFLKGFNDNIIMTAYGLGNGFINVLCYSFIYALTIGLLTRLCQAYGDKAYRLMGLYLHRGFIINLFASVFVTGLLYFSKNLFQMLNYEEDLTNALYDYLVWNIPGVYLSMIYYTFTYYLLALKIVTPTAIMQIIAAPVYVFSSYLLCEYYGLQLRGAAISLWIMNGYLTIAVIAYIWIKNPCPDSIFWLNKNSFRQIWDLFKHEILIGSVVFIQWVGIEVIGLASGTLSLVMSSAYTATCSILNMLNMIPAALDNSVITYVSSVMGQGYPEKAKILIIGTALNGFISGSVIATFLYFLWGDMITYFLQDPDAIAASRKMLNIYLLALVFDYTQVILGASMRAVDKKTTGLVISLICQYGMTLPLAYLFCFQYGWGINGLQWGLDVGIWANFTLNLVFLMACNLRHQSEQIVRKIAQDKALAVLRRSKIPPEYMSKVATKADLEDSQWKISKDVDYVAMPDEASKIENFKDSSKIGSSFVQG